MQMDNDRAFDVFFEDRVDVTAKRKQGTSVLTFSGAVKCSIIVGQSPGDGGAQLSRQAGDHYAVIVRALDYPVHEGPQMGDTLQHLIYGTLTVQQVQRYRNDYELHCLGRGVKR